MFPGESSKQSSSSLQKTENSFYCFLIIVGAHAIMANAVGLHMTAVAAQKHAVPFVVLAGSHKVN